MPDHRENRQSSRDAASSERAELDRNYRSIGISAVAAAAPYCPGAESKQSKTRKSVPRHEDEAA